MMKLLFIDLETTGLNPRKDDIVEVGAILIEVDAENHALRRLGGFQRLNRKVDFNKIKNAHVLEMHKKSGLWEIAVTERQSSSYNKSMSLRGIEEQLLQDMRFAGFELGKVMIAGYSPHFDLGFITQQMPLLRSALHHRVFDVSTLQTIWLETNEEAANAAKDEEAKKHRAVADCEQALQTFVKWLRAWTNIYKWEIVPPPRSL